MLKRKWMTCPKCGADGVQMKYFDRFIDKWVNEFTCDKSLEHHYLIVELEPAVLAEAQ